MHYTDPQAPVVPGAGGSQLSSGSGSLMAPRSVFQAYHSEVPEQVEQSVYRPAEPAGDQGGATQWVHDMFASRGGSSTPTSPQWDPKKSYEQNERAQADFEAKSVERQGELREQATKAKGDVMQQALQADADTAKQQAEAHAAGQKRADEAEAQLRKQAADVADMKVDPNRYFKNMSTWGHIGTAISMAIGGYLSVATKTGVNPALQFIEHEIDRDIDAQKAEITNKRAGVDTQRGILQLQSQRGAEQDQYFAGLRAGALQRAAQQAEAAAMQFAPGIERENALQLASQARAKAEEQIQGEKDRQAQLGATYAQIAQAKDFHRDQMNVEIAKLLQSGQVEQARLLQQQALSTVWGVKGANGQPFVLGNPEMAGKANATISSAQKLYSDLDELKSLRAKYGWQRDTVLPTDAAREMEAQRGRVLLDLKEVAASRGLPESEMAVFEDMIGKSATGLGDQTARWEQLQKGLVRDTNQHLKNQYGFTGQWQPDEVQKAQVAKELGADNKTIDTSQPTGQMAPAGIPPSPPAPSDGTVGLGNGRDLFKPRPR
jgi:hypothetical protein